LRTKNIVILLVVFAMLGGLAYGAYAWARPEPKPIDPKEYVWLIEQEDISRVTMTLPREEPPLSHSFVQIRQEDKFPWFFDDAEHSPVDAQRWGGGIGLLLSGPGADRVINREATAEQLTLYGFDSPIMEITLEFTNRSPMIIRVGDRTPNAANYYVKAPGANAVATVDYTWYDVLSKIVKEPPYAIPPTTAPK
jgi:hypothetical protein